MKIKFAASALALAASAVAATSVQAEKFTVAHGFVPTHAATVNAVEPFMACVTEKSGGDVTFDHYPSGQISGHRESITSMNNGLADISAVVPAYESGKLPLNNLSMLPELGGSVTKMNAAFREMTAEGSPMLEEWHAQGVHPLMIIMTPTYQLMSMGAPVTSMDQFKGMKIRAGGGTATMLVNSIDGVPVEMATPEMFVALQRGTVDATILSLPNAPAYGLPDILKSISRNGSFGSGMAVVAMNREAYDNLSDAQKAVMAECGAETEASGGKIADDQDASFADTFASQGIEVYEFSPELLTEINKRLASVSEEFVARMEANGVENARSTYEAYVKVMSSGTN